MKVFLSWSGEQSRSVAVALEAWLPRVLQAVRPWISRSIPKGTRWGTAIANELANTSFGIICLTPDNLAKPWILFEAGALSKTLTDAFVCPFLVGVSPSELTPPLSEFQVTLAEKDDVLRLVTDMNALLRDSALREEALRDTFEMWWPRLETQLKQIAQEKPKPKKKRDESEVLEELVERVRNMERSVVTKTSATGEFTYPMKQTLQGSLLPADVYRDVAQEQEEQFVRIYPNARDAFRSARLQGVPESLIHILIRQTPTTDADRTIGTWLGKLTSLSGIPLVFMKDR